MIGINILIQKIVEPNMLELCDSEEFLTLSSPIIIDLKSTLKLLLKSKKFSPSGRIAMHRVRFENVKFNCNYLKKKKKKKKKITDL